MAIRDEARKLRDAGKLDEAAKRLTQAHDLKIDGIEGLMAAEEEAIETARRKAEDERQQAIDKTIAAYEKESDKVWGLFKERRYEEADKLLVELAARLEFQPAANQLEADREAAKLLKDFWAAVEKGLHRLNGERLTIGQISGRVTEVKNGKVTLSERGVAFGVQIAEKLPAAQALRLAGLKQDARSSLLRGVFLLAERQGLKDVAAALAAAGKPADAPASLAQDACCEWSASSRGTSPRRRCAPPTPRDSPRCAEGPRQRRLL